jgi:Flp pilus assembly pilin Flp
MKIKSNVRSGANAVEYGLITAVLAPPLAIPLPFTSTATSTR